MRKMNTQIHLKRSLKTLKMNKMKKRQKMMKKRKVTMTLNSS